MLVLLVIKEEKERRAGNVGDLLWDDVPPAGSNDDDAGRYGLYR